MIRFSFKGNIHKVFLVLTIFLGCKKDAIPQIPVPQGTLTYYKVWDDAPHNAFTDMTLFKNNFYLVLREGEEHASNDGDIRVLRSKDGKTFTSIARFSDPNFDLRDPKIVNLGDTLLYIQYGMANRDKKIMRNGMQWSKNGKDWNTKKVFSQNDTWWLWGVTNLDGKLLSAGYNPYKNDFNTLYLAKKPGEYTSVAKVKTSSFSSGEATLASKGDTVFCAIRATHYSLPSYIGYALKKDLSDWKCVGQNTDLILGGPKLFFLPNGKLYLVTRSSRDGKLKTCLYNVDRTTFKLSYILTLPSEGDNAYGGIAYTKTDLFISYYSTMEEKTSIYVSRIPLSSFK